jgi:amphi-Trp domain-containing protein
VKYSTFDTNMPEAENLT